MMNPHELEQLDRQQLIDVALEQMVTITYLRKTLQNRNNQYDELAASIRETSAALQSLRETVFDE